MNMNQDRKPCAGLCGNPDCGLDILGRPLHSLVKTNGDFRAKLDWIGCAGTFYFKVQKRRWWGWRTVGKDITDPDKVLDKLANLSNE